MDREYSLYLTERAKRDIKDIQRYTLQAHGSAQVRDYAETIKTCLGKLGTHPQLGHERVDIPKGYRAWPVGKHVAVYRVEDRAIYVLAILHGRMNFTDQI